MILRTSDIVAFLLKAEKGLAAKVQRHLLKSYFYLYRSHTKSSPENQFGIAGDLIIELLLL